MFRSASSSTSPENPIYPEFDPANPLASGASLVKNVLLSPKRFFLEFSPEGPLKEPTAFVVLVSAVTAVLSVVVTLVGDLFFASLGGREVGLTILQALLFVVLSPVGVAVAAAVYLLAVKTFIGPVADFGGIYRMACYAYAPLVLGWIPGVNAFAVTYALLVVMAVAIRFVYRTTFLTALISALVAFVPLELALIALKVSAAGMFAG